MEITEGWEDQAEMKSKSGNKEYSAEKCRALLRGHYIVIEGKI